MSDAELSDYDLEDDEYDDLPEEINFADLEWTTVGTEDQSHRENEFYGLHGLHPRFEPTDSDSESFFFDIMFPDDLFEDLAEFTNIRAHKEIDGSTENLSASSRLNKWKDVTPDEMRKFVACVFLMGIIKKPTVESYWSKETMTETPFFSTEKCLSRDRFQIILRFIRFSNYNRHDVSANIFYSAVYVPSTVILIQ